MTLLRKDNESKPEHNDISDQQTHANLALAQGSETAAIDFVAENDASNYGRSENNQESTNRSTTKSCP